MCTESLSSIIHSLSAFPFVSLSDSRHVALRNTILTSLLVPTDGGSKPHFCPPTSSVFCRREHTFGCSTRRSTPRFSTATVPHRMSPAKPRVSVVFTPHPPLLPPPFSPTLLLAISPYYTSMAKSQHPQTLASDPNVIFTSCLHYLHSASLTLVRSTPREHCQSVGFHLWICCASEPSNGEEYPSSIFVSIAVVFCFYVRHVVYGCGHLFLCPLRYLLVFFSSLFDQTRSLTRCDRLLPLRFVLSNVGCTCIISSPVPVQRSYYTPPAFAAEGQRRFFVVVFIVHRPISPPFFTPKKIPFRSSY